MAVAITVASILMITGGVALLNRFLRVRICPICAGVAATWLWILTGTNLGLLEAGSQPVRQASWHLVAAFLMGGSVVGIAYQVERRLAPGRSQLLWKALFIPAGFVAAYALLQAMYLAVVVSAGLLALIAFFFLRSPLKVSSEQSARAAELEERMKHCC